MLMQLQHPMCDLSLDLFQNFLARINLTAKDPSVSGKPNVVKYCIYPSIHHVSHFPWHLQMGEGFYESFHPIHWYLYLPF